MVRQFQWDPTIYILVKIILAAADDMFITFVCIFQKKERIDISCEFTWKAKDYFLRKIIKKKWECV